jgi:hypothetical protein
MCKKLLVLFLLISLQNVLLSQNQDKNHKYPKNSLVITPLMGLIEDTKPSIYYRRYLVNDSVRLFSLRFGTELLSNVEHTFSTGLMAKTKGLNFKIGFEYGKKFRKSTVYFGGELSNSSYKGNGAIIYPDQNALFNNNSLLFNKSGSIGDEATLNIFAIIGFIGFKYELVDRISIGIESSIGYGWYKSKLLYADPFFVASENYKGNLSQVIPNRFIFVEIDF